MGKILLIGGEYIFQHRGSSWKPDYCATEQDDKVFKESSTS